jgi:nitrogen fixation protein NifB
MLVNQHLGEADRFLIYTEGKDRFNLVDTRLAPTPGTGRKRWVDLAETLNDCRAILVGALGETPKTILEQAGIQPVEMYGFIEEGLSAIYEGRDVRSLKGRRVSCTDATGCTGTGLGCG